jgi:choline-sulfatase
MPSPVRWRSRWRARSWRALPALPPLDALRRRGNTARTLADGETTSARARARRIAAWVGATAAAAAVGALAGGIAEAGFGDGVHETAASTGYAALIAWPALFALVAIARGLWAAWQPAVLRAALVEDHGAAPRLAAWLAYLLLGCFVLSWATFNAIGLLAGWTTFKPAVISLAVPPVVVAVGLALAAASRPAVRAIAAALRTVDRGVRTYFKRSFLTPRIVLAGAAALLVALMVVGWYVSVEPRIGYLDLAILTHPIAALIATAIGYQVLARIPARPALVVRAAIGALIVAAIAVALATRATRPSEVLKIWARPTIAGEVIERLYDLEDLREDTLLAVPPARRPGATPRDVVLLTIDTVRYDRTPIGGGPAEMPAVAALGDAGAAFTAAFAPGNVTRRSIPSIASGVAPNRIKGKVAGWALRLDPRHIMLAERFRAAGYDTVGFFCCPSFWDSRHKLGINRGFDHITIDSSGGEALSAATADYLAARRRAGTGKPLFLWVHFIDAHNWVPKGTSFKTPEDRRAQYDKLLAEVDGYVGRIVHELAATTGDRAPIIAVTADHGEALGDHKTPYHSTDLYDTQIQVPLVIAGPGIGPRRIAEPVGLTSLAPTLLDLAGFVPPGMPEMDGTSFADLVTGARTADPDRGFAEAAMIKDRSAPKNLRAVIRGTWKLIETPSGFELYDRRTDPGELRNLAKANPAKLAELKALLAERKRLDAISPFK